MTLDRTADGFAFDVFVSYRHADPDRAWVREVLVPRLNRESLRVCIDYQTFQYGRPLLMEMERAVVTSRYTVAVLTPRYLRSEFTDLEAALAQSVGLDAARWRLLALMREDCSPTRPISALHMLDVRDAACFDEAAATLCQRLRVQIELDR